MLAFVAKNVKKCSASTIAVIAENWNLQSQSSTSIIQLFPHHNKTLPSGKEIFYLQNISTKDFLLKKKNRDKTVKDVAGSVR